MPPALWRRATKKNLAEIISVKHRLDHLIAAALLQVGEDDEDGTHTKQVSEKLAELYIKTPDQLRLALDTPEVLEQVMNTALRGMLLPAVRTELKHDEHTSLWSKARKKETKASSALPSPLKRSLKVVRADITQLSAIDQLSQTFRARIFLIFLIKDGALDEHLIREFDGFPIDDHGRPTFRPSAKWYLNQIDFPNGRDINTLESKVTTAGSDIQLIKRIEGEFFERFELQSFPFDAQDLTITVSANCATEGPVPMEFAEGGANAQLGVDTVNFAFGDVWDLSPSLACEFTTVGATSKRRFPAVHLRACVARKSGFVVLNVALPTGVIAFLSVTTFFVEEEATGNKLDLSVVILLTAVAFKSATSTYLPQISCTLPDD